MLKNNCILSKKSALILSLSFIAIASVFQAAKAAEIISATLNKETYLPVIADPSHGTGRRDLIYNMSCAAIAAGANGLMIEVHPNPAEALVDALQAITPEELKEIIDTCHKIHQLTTAKRNN